MNYSLNKKQIRKQIKKKKLETNNVSKQKMNISVINKLKKNNHFIDAKNILFYWALDDELNLNSLIKDVLNNKNIFLPRVNNNNEIDVVKLTSIDDMVYGKYNILEPTGKAIPNIDEINLTIVPGIAFTCSGKRLGRGGGYYDKLLPKLINSYNIGVGYSFQIIDEIPTENHDVILNDVIVGDNE